MFAAVWLHYGKSRIQLDSQDQANTLILLWQNQRPLLWCNSWSLTCPFKLLLTRSYLIKIPLLFCASHGAIVFERVPSSSQPTVWELGPHTRKQNTTNMQKQITSGTGGTIVAAVHAALRAMHHLFNLSGLWLSIVLPLQWPEELSRVW